MAECIPDSADKFIMKLKIIEKLQNCFCKFYTKSKIAKSEFNDVFYETLVEENFFIDSTNLYLESQWNNV